jgi:hypothetical protein
MNNKLSGSLQIEQSTSLWESFAVEKESISRQGSQWLAPALFLDAGLTAARGFKSSHGC